MNPLRRRSLRRAIFAAVAIATVVVVVLVALVAAGVLVLPSNSTAPVTITSVHLVIEQGKNANNVSWLGPSSINMTAGYPYQVAPGANWSVSWFIQSFDTVNHSVYKVIPTSVPKTTAGTNFTIGGYQVAGNWVRLPFVVPPLDEVSFQIFVAAPNQPGGSFALTLTVNALTIS